MPARKLEGKGILLESGRERDGMRIISALWRYQPEGWKEKECLWGLREGCVCTHKHTQTHMAGGGGGKGRGRERGRRERQRQTENNLGKCKMLLGNFHILYWAQEEAI